MDTAVDEDLTAEIKRLRSHITDLELKLRIQSEIVRNITQAIHQVNNALGIRTHRSGRKHYRPRCVVTDILRKLWCDLYQSGQSIKTIASSHHVHVNTVTRVIRHAGIYKSRAY